MGQILHKMGQPQSKDALLFQSVNAGDVEAVKALRGEGANLECIDQDGKTPLIAACLNPVLIDVAKTLIEMGANLNAYRPGRDAGTPLHHAAKTGLEQTVKLLLSHGSNSLVRNDDCQTPLDVARIKGHTNVVRTIESHICYFSGWLREIHSPGFLEALVPQLFSRKIWAVVIPCGSGNSMKPHRCELAIYPTLLDARPRNLISLWKAKIEEPKFHNSDPMISIFDPSSETRYKLASANEGDKNLLQCLYNACRGIPQVMPSPALHNAQTGVTSYQNAAEAEPQKMKSSSTQSDTKEKPPLLPSTAQNSETIHANGWVSSVDIDIHNGWGSAVTPAYTEASSSGWMDEPVKEDYNGWGVSDSKPSSKQEGYVQADGNDPSLLPNSGGYNAPDSLAPSAPPIPAELLGEGIIQYPSADHIPVDLSVPGNGYGVTASDAKDGADSSSWVICWEAPIQGACIPCGHMAGCMSCLTEIKAKKGVCPVCRAKIHRVLRLYTVG